VNLIVDGQTDLQTLQATANDFATFNRGLASLTGQLQASNSDIQALIRNSQAAAQEVNPFLASERTAIDGLIYNLAIGSAVSNAYQPQVQAMFQLLPVVSSDLATVAGGGQVRGELTFNTANTVCPYILGSQMPGPTQRVSTPVLTNSCPTSAPDMLKRGAPK
jgi:ABC-type transporter Mla subunit MlaD